MDAGGVGALIGISVMVVCGIGFCIYDRCARSKNPEYVPVVNPLLRKNPSFKVKNLFNHVEL